MSKCQICDVCEIGSVYSVGPGICYECAAPIPEHECSYLGFDGQVHKFRIHPKFNCPTCGAERVYAIFYCDDVGDLEVTDALRQLKEQEG